MIKNIFQPFASMIADLWYNDCDELIDKILSKVVAMCIVTLVIVSIGLICSILLICIYHPVIFLYIALPFIIVYCITKKLVAYGKKTNDKEI